MSSICMIFHIMHMHLAQGKKGKGFYDKGRIL